MGLAPKLFMFTVIGYEIEVPVDACSVWMTIVTLFAIEPVKINSPVDWSE